MNIESLVQRLKNNSEERKIFFKQVTAPEFLPHFEKHNMLRFDDVCAAEIITYLTVLVKNNANLKDKVAEIINKNLEEVKDISGYVFDNLINLLKNYDIDEIESKIDYVALFAKDDFGMSYKLILKNDISKKENLYKELIKSLIEYKVKDDKNWGSVNVLSKHNSGIYEIEGLLNSPQYSVNLKKILKHDEVFKLLFETYKKITKTRAKELNIIHRQYIKSFEQVENSLVAQYDIRNIILDYMAVYVEQNSLAEGAVKKLLNSKILMLVKLGLYAIVLNFDKYKSFYVEFFNKFDVKDVVYYLYELMTVLEKTDLNEDFCSKIYDRVMGFDEYLRFIFLHALEDKPMFHDEFVRLSEKFGSRIHSPKLVMTIKNFSFKPKSEIKKDSAAYHFKQIEKLKKEIAQNNDAESLFKKLEKDILLLKKGAEGEKSQNLSFDNVKYPLGQYLKLWLLLFARETGKYSDKISFIKNNFNQNVTLPNQLLYYNIGTYYAYVKNVYEPDLSVLELKEAFIEGFVNSRNNQKAELWSKFKEDIYSYIKKFGAEDIPRKNLIYSLIYIKFFDNGDDVFEYFYDKFDKKDKETFIHNMLFPTRKQYKNDKVIKFWHGEVNSNDIYSPQLLLTMFNEYVKVDGFEKYLDDLKKLFNQYKQFCSVRNCLELDEFLQKIYAYLSIVNYQTENEKIDLKGEIFEFLKEFVPVFASYETIFPQEAALLRDILLKYFEKFGDKGNVQVLYKLICETKNLIQYLDLFQSVKEEIKK